MTKQCIVVNVEGKTYYGELITHRLKVLSNINFFLVKSRDIDNEYYLGVIEYVDENNIAKGIRLTKHPINILQIMYDQLKEQINDIKEEKDLWHFFETFYI